MRRFKWIRPNGVTEYKDSPMALFYLRHRYIYYRYKCCNYLFNLDYQIDYVHIRLSSFLFYI